MSFNRDPREVSLAESAEASAWVLTLGAQYLQVASTFSSSSIKDHFIKFWVIRLQYLLRNPGFGVGCRFVGC